VSKKWSHSRQAVRWASRRARICFSTAVKLTLILLTRRRTVAEKFLREFIGRPKSFSAIALVKKNTTFLHDKMSCCESRNDTTKKKMTNSVPFPSFSLHSVLLNSFGDQYMVFCAETGRQTQACALWA